MEIVLQQKSTTDQLISHPSRTFDDFYSLIQQLKMHQLESVQTGNLADAEMTKIKIENIKIQQKRLRKESIQKIQQEEMNKILEQNAIESQQFENKWKTIMQQLQCKMKNEQEKLNQVHRKQIQQTMKLLNEEKCPPVKFSNQILLLRNKFEKLIKVRQYGKANQLKEQIKNLEQIETVRWEQNNQKTKYIKLEKVQKRHQIQMRALLSRFNTRFNQQIKNKQKQWQILSRKLKVKTLKPKKISDDLFKKKSITSRKDSILGSTYDKNTTKKYPNLLNFLD